MKDLEMLTANTEIRLNGHTLRVDSFEHELMGTVIEDGGHVEWLKPGLMIFVR